MWHVIEARVQQRTLLERAMWLALVVSPLGLAAGVAGCGAALAPSGEVLAQSRPPEGECRESPSASLPEYPPGSHRDVVELERIIRMGDASDHESDVFLLELASAYRDARRSSAEIQALFRVVRDHPDSGQLDRALFQLGTALVREGNADAARTSLLRLIRAFPESRWVQGAYVALAELAWSEGDPRAADELLEVATRIPGSYSAYAHYRRAWALASVGDPAAPSALDAAEALLSEGGMLETSALQEAIETDRPTITRARCAAPTPEGR